MNKDEQENWASIRGCGRGSLPRVVGKQEVGNGRDD
jgi:hypothetical protein